MLGKPVRGQRTWSNSWNSYNLNKPLRNFISETKRNLSKVNKTEKINYKVVKKKYITKNKFRKKELSKIPTIAYQYHEIFLQLIIFEGLHGDSISRSLV